jgi:hypothetical protein
MIPVRKIQRFFNFLVLCCGGLVTVGFSAVIQSPSQTAIDAAIAAPLISYGRSYAGGAYTNGAWFGGGSIVLAAASHAGNTRADSRLLQQIRHTLTGGNEICANGGYPAQHERHVTGMFAIVRKTPRIWGQLTAAEKTRADLMMKAGLVASAFTTSNNNPYILANTQQYTLDGDSNLNRAWNPNYREGMIGGVLVGMVYFGGATETEAILNSYNHAQFLSALNANGLSNAARTFNWKLANPSSAAPTASMIENGVRNYQFFNSKLADYLGIYTSLVNDTYGKNVNAGLNGGAGVNGSGKIYSGAAGLPMPGALGMLKEFDSSDGGGPRSSLGYAYDGFRPHQTNQLVLIIGGYWPKGSSAASAAVARMEIGNADLWYKISKSYIDYYSGQGRGVVGTAFVNERGFPYVRSLWEDVLQPYHRSNLTGGELDSDGDGTRDEIELRLGLDPLNGQSRFSAERVGGVLRWPSAVGETFRIQRSAGESALVVWETIATVAGVAGFASFTDPLPPIGRAMYRVLLD